MDTGHIVGGCSSYVDVARRATPEIKNNRVHACKTVVPGYPPPRYRGDPRGMA